MKVDVVSVGSYQKKLVFAVPGDQVTAELDKAFRNLSQQARLKGFRPGKVPRKVLEARFGDQIKQDVAGSLIQSGYESALTNHGIEPVGRPQVQDRTEVAAGDEFAFTITVEVKPELVLEQYQGMEVVYPPVEVTDEEVERSVKSRLEGQAKLVEVTDRPVSKGDMALIELVATDGETEVIREPGTMIRTESDPYFPGIEALVEGVGVNEERTGTVSFGANARIEAVKGRTLTTTVKVISIQSTNVPELTDELSGELGFEGGVEGMKLALRLQLQQSREAAARNQARANLLQVLIHHNTFQIPEGMIDSHLNMLVEELKHQQSYLGRDPRKLRFSPEQMADLRVRAEFAAKGGLILDFVAKKEGLSITEEDLEAKYQELADQRGQTVEAIRGYFVKDGAVDELRARLMEEKTLDWLLEHAKLVSEGATPPMRSQRDIDGDSAGA